MKREAGGSQSRRNGDGHRRSELERLEGGLLLALEMEEGPRSQGMQVASRKGQDMESPEPPEGTSCANTLILTL